MRKGNKAQRKEGKKENEWIQENRRGSPVIQDQVERGPRIV